MSIMHRTLQQPARAECKNGSSNGSSNGNNMKNGKHWSTRFAFSKTRHGIVHHNRQSKKKTPLTRKLMWAIGGIAMFLAVVNYIYSLKHQGFLPSGITVRFSFGGGSHSKWVLGKAPQHGNDDVPSLELLAPVHNHKQGLSKRLAASASASQRQRDMQAMGLQRNHPNNNRQQAGGDGGIWDGLKKYNVNLQNDENGGPHRHDNAKAAARRNELMAKANAVLDARNQVHAKEAKKGNLRPLHYFLRLSQKEGHDKEEILKLIRENAGIQYISDATYKELPSMANVKEMYGDHPRLIAMDQCAKFQRIGNLADKYLGVAGTFNSGTNFLAKLLTRNCVLHHRQEKYGVKQRGIRWQVPYGKHTPPGDAEFRKTHVAQKSGGVDVSEVLPVVMIRDPFRWLQSMCTHHYTSRWPRVFPRTDPRYHCPNLYPSADEVAQLAALSQKPLVEGEPIVKETSNDVKRNYWLERELYIGIRAKKNIPKQYSNNLKGAGGDSNNEPGDVEESGQNDDETAENVVYETETDTSLLTDEDLHVHHFPMSIKYSNYTRHYRSLVHHWNEWYQEYLELEDYPHIIVRMEDLLFFPDQVVPRICECAGGRLLRTSNVGNQTVKVVATSAKSKHSTKYMEEGEEHTGYLDALIKYGHSATRFKGMTPHDLQYARRYLDPDMMDLFGYGYPEESLMTGSSGANSDAATDKDE